MILVLVAVEKNIKNVVGNKELFEEVKKLKLPRDKYALFGSGPLGIRKLRNCRDIDIILNKNLWNKYKKENWKIATNSYGNKYLKKDKIELWKDWYPGEWDIELLIKESETIEGLQFVRLEQVLKSKILSNRKKDQEDIKRIRKYLLNKNK